jgi:hypothetical protein
MSVLYLHIIANLLTCALAVKAGLVTFAFNGIPADLELYLAADTALPHKDLANIK